MTDAPTLHRLIATQIRRMRTARTRDTMRLVGIQLPPDATPPDDSNV